MAPCMSFHLSNPFSVSGWSPTGNHSQDRSSGVTYKNHRCRGLFLGSGLDILDLEISGTSNWMEPSLHFYLPLGPLFHGFAAFLTATSPCLVFETLDDLDGKWFFWSHLFQVLSSDQWPSTHRVLWFFGRAPWTCLVCENCGGMRRVYPDIVSKCI